MFFQKHDYVFSTPSCLPFEDKRKGVTLRYALLTLPKFTSYFGSVYFQKRKPGRGTLPRSLIPVGEIFHKLRPFVQSRIRNIGII